LKRDTQRSRLLCRFSNSRYIPCEHLLFRLHSVRYSSHSLDHRGWGIDGFSAGRFGALGPQCANACGFLFLSFALDTINWARWYQSDRR